ncbi:MULTISPECIES: hypothetical protein [Lysinibacillus]|uniref:hypothetical protein n=1 Tax=Lysinibacillus TaxID=400634 RepID=UPI000D35CA17|nr:MULTISPECIES: hypothetical protein [Lysinibacillus]MED4670323.1 hypothetical protein [Lysinibacillus fusiformis]QAS56580.1 hypothetical protein LSP_09445 [Lysinibacillus sphaericus]RDV30373.1 hypothetical protein C7B90_15310 [Lysinibacillus fusiformis]GED66285.1 hypothetical protein LFU01_47370 [Lysinibacillus fusiformis]
MEKNFIVQYELEFPNEYTSDLVKQVGEIMEIPTNLARETKFENIQDFESESEIIRIMTKPENPSNFILVKFSKVDWYYAIVIRCNQSVHEKIKHVLMELNENIIEEYGDSPYDSIENVFSSRDNLLLKYAERFNIPI